MHLHKILFYLCIVYFVVYYIITFLNIFIKKSNDISY